MVRLENGATETIRRLSYKARFDWLKTAGCFSTIKAIMAIALIVWATLAATACDSSDNAANVKGAEGDIEYMDREPADSTDSVGREVEGLVTVPDPSDGDNPHNLASLKRLGYESFRPALVNPSGFINAKPFTLNDFNGQVVLIDFWTYTCINCIRTLPFLKDWHAKYAADGLVIIGVHSPEFEFEKVRANVESAANDFGIEYRIVQDNDFGTWRNYENRYWPAKYLIDRDGYIRYTHFGEGAYEETELKIRELLAENAGVVASKFNDFLPSRVYDPDAQGIDDPQFSLTRELYAGTDRNYDALRFGGQPPYIKHEQYYARPNTSLEYKDPGVHDNHFIYLNGLWRNGPESLTHARTTDTYEDYVAIKFFGTSANIVVGVSEEGESYTVRVTIDDEPISSDHAGEDVMWDERGNSYLLVDESRMYRVAKTPKYDAYELRLASNSANFEVFAFTFGMFRNTDGG